MKTWAIGIIASSMVLASTSVLAAPYANENQFAVDGKAMKVTETSARLLSNPEGTAPLLVEDITDGMGKTKIPGYKVMVMTRALSTAFDARKKDDGTIENLKTVHRGGKILFGIPVKNGKMNVNEAKVLSLGLISDEGKTFTPNNKDTAPSGEQKFADSSKVTALSYKINSLTLPNLKSGERVGGGISYKLHTVVDGHTYDVSANTVFPSVETKGQPKHLKAFPAKANVFEANR